MPSLTLQCLAVCLVSALLCWLALPQILRVAFRKRLFDEVDDRKIHTDNVPRLGGVAFMPVICFTLALAAGVEFAVEPGLVCQMGFNGRQMAFGFCALLLMYSAGVADDMVELRYRAKFLVQIICGLLLIAGGLGCYDFRGLLGLDEMNVLAGAGVTLLMIVFIINAVNLIDGIDGLASGLAMVTFLVYGLAFAAYGNAGYAAVSFSAFGVLVPFFCYNVFGSAKRHTKIFMGDTGTLTVGLIICFLGLGLLKQPANTEPVLESENWLRGANCMILVLAPLCIPCFDVVRVFVQRLQRHGNPFKADRTHIHHRLLDAGLSGRQVMAVLVSASLAMTVADIVLSLYLNINMVVLANIVVWVVGLQFIPSRRDVASRC